MWAFCCLKLLESLMGNRWHADQVNNMRPDVKALPYHLDRLVNPDFQKILLFGSSLSKGIKGLALEQVDLTAEYKPLSIDQPS